jgi:hypothetical protein
MPTGWRRPILLGIVTILLVSVGLFSWSSRSNASSDLGPGDPGGRILDQLRPLATAVPRNAKVDYAHFQEAQLDSCDGVPSTRGWDGPVVQIRFNWNGSTATLLGHANHRLKQLGWKQAAPPSVGPGAEWTKRLKNGSGVTASLEGFGGGWTLFAQAPPVGKLVSGC